MNLTLDIENVDALYKAYMPFLRYGGLYVHSDVNYCLGSDVELKFTLLGVKKVLQVNGQVCWWNPTTSSKKGGVGIAFTKEDEKINNVIIKLLGDRLNTTQLNHTM